jgi:hypothetical protein
VKTVKQMEGELDAIKGVEHGLPARQTERRQ